MTTHIVPNIKTDSLRRIVLRNVERGSVVSTDEPKSYNLLTSDGYRHGVVNQNAKEYVRGGAPHKQRLVILAAVQKFDPFDAHPCVAEIHGSLSR